MLEGLGFASEWIGGSSGMLGTLDAVLTATTRLLAATSIVQIWETADEIAAEHHRLNSAHGGRFLLGLGVGHAPLVERSGRTYARPLRKLSRYLDDLDSAEYPVPTPQRVIAALGPRTLGIAATCAAGAHPLNVSPEHTVRLGR